MTWTSTKLVRKAPVRTGIYAVYLSGQLVYVGLAVNIRRRLKQHPIRNSPCGTTTTPWGHGRTVVIKFSLSRRIGDEVRREARLISRLKPRGNRRLYAA